MKTRQIALLLATVLFATAAYAGDQEHQKIEIKVISDDGDGETHLSLDSEELGFNLRDVSFAETRADIQMDHQLIGCDLVTLRLASSEAQPVDAPDK